MKTVKPLAIGLLIILLIIFIAQNLPALIQGQSLKLNLLFFSYNSPPLALALLLAACLTLGFLTAWLMGFRERLRLKRQIKDMSRLQTRTQDELNSLRNLPILGDSHVPAEKRPMVKGEPK